jgi:methylenetetrahydrofolate reductase (NADPH)
MRTFRQAAQAGAFTITADLTLQGHSDSDDVARQVDLLGPCVDAIQVNDHAWNAVHMSGVAAASLVLRQGTDPVATLSCRDRNRIALYQDMLGLRALGVTSILLSRGPDIAKNQPVKTQAVFDMSVTQLIAMATSFNDLDPPVPDKEFHIGVGAKVLRTHDEWDAKSLRERSGAGARFLQLQLCFNMDMLRHYMQSLIAKRLTWDCSVIVTLAPLPSAEVARWVKKHVGGARIARAVIDRLEAAADPRREGIEICAEWMREIAAIPGVGGIHLMTMGSPESIKASIVASGLR